MVQKETSQAKRKKTEVVKLKKFFTYLLDALWIFLNFHFYFDAGLGFGGHYDAI